jgi:hypothetical protein
MASNVVIDHAITGMESSYGAYIEATNSTVTNYFTYSNPAVTTGTTSTPTYYKGGWIGDF